MLTIPKSAIQVAHMMCAKEGGKFPLHCARVREFQDQYWIEATDGKVLAIIRGTPMAVTGVLTPQVDEEQYDYLVPAAEVVKCLDRREDRLVLAASDKVVRLGTSRGIFEFPVGQGRIPDVDMVMDGCVPVFSVRIAANLLKCIASAALLMEDSKDAIPSVTLHISLGNVRSSTQGAVTPVGYSIRGSNGSFCEGVLMPLSFSQ